MSNRFIEKLHNLAPLGQDEVAAPHKLLSRPKPMAARKDIIREGDRPGPLIVILEGWAFRYEVLPEGSRQVTGFLMPGDACDLHAGLMAEMDHSIQTVTPATVCKIERRDMDSVLEQYPQVAKALHLAQLIDEGTLRAWITSIGRRDSVTRVAHLICELYLRAKNVGLPVEPEFALPISQIILADALGLTPVHVNRVLRELRLAGVMTLTKGVLVITEPIQLVRIAGFDESYLHRRVRVAV